MDANFFPFGVCVWAVTDAWSFGSDDKQVAACCDRIFAKLAQRNFNTACLNGLPLEHMPGACQAARRHNIKLIYALPGTDKNAMDRVWSRSEAEAIVLPAVQELHDCEELVAYFVCDEPSLLHNGRYVNNIITLRQVIASVDEDRPVLTNFNVPAMTAALFQQIQPEVLITDPYVLNAESPLGHLASFIPWLEYCRGLAGDTPLWVIQQGHGSMWGRRAPTPVEVRKMFFLALAHGVTGVLYFIYNWTGVQDTLVDREGQDADGRLAEMGRLGAVAAKLAPVLPNLKPADFKATTSDPEVEITLLADKDWYRTFQTDHCYFFLVNHNIRQNKIGTAYSYMGTGTLGDHYDILSGQEVISGQDVKVEWYASRGLVSFHYELEPGAGKLFRIPVAAEPPD